MSSSVVDETQTVSLPPPRPSNFSKGEIEGIAWRIAKSLEFEPGSDLLPIVREKLGGEVHFIELDEWLDDRTDTIEVPGDGTFHIYLSKVGGLLRNRFTLAHELGHYFLHSQLGKIQMKASRNGGASRVEWEANWFAAEFLMPTGEFLEAMKKDSSVNALAAKFLVSPSAVRVRKQILEQR